MDNTDPLDYAFRFSNFSNIMQHSDAQRMYAVLYATFSVPEAIRFLDALWSAGEQTGFYSSTPAILLRNWQDFQDRSDFAEWSWYVADGYQLWDTHLAKPIYVLAKSEQHAFDLFYHYCEPELEYINQLPSGSCTDYDEKPGEEDCVFKFAEPAKITALDCAWSIWNDSKTLK